ncbi:ABC transporter permease [Streptomyces sp. R39]|uniref:ABC transporter permease n=1 Tax=Streptomyces sp. R39 TaxID=3238631 RepID=A0AB39QGS3_9ACTN
MSAPTHVGRTGIGALFASRRLIFAHPQLTFVAKRLRRFILSLLALVTASFAMIHMVPGDPVRAALGPSASQALVDQTRTQLGLNRSLAGQFFSYLHGVLSGDLGSSIIQREPVGAVLQQRLPATAALAVAALLLTIVVGVSAGMLTGALGSDGRRRATDYAFTVTTGLFAAVPEYLLGVGLVYVLAVSLGWFPVAGHAGLSSYVLPVVALAAGPAAVIARMVRVETRRALREGYVLTARSKRLSGRVVYLRHLLPNVLTSVLTFSGLLFGGLIAGTVVVENVFAWPGVGATIVTAITGKDYALVQGIVLVYGAAILAVNLLVDVAIAAIDPRSSLLDR